ncbi:MAG: hypothetical protein FWG20_02850 [Candidatus Cloacimonetes bacterium]|nr:hypothetical protein [Candidatus Cloacimonadota bacterium]
MKPSRCKKCKTNIGHRYCLRTDKYLCHECCNVYRVDFNCPKSCGYHIPEKDIENVPTSVKSDSLAEFYDLIGTYINKWKFRPAKFLDGQTPYDAKSTPAGGEKLLNYFKTDKLDIDFAKVIEDNLEIDLKSSKLPKLFTSEGLACDFMTEILEDRWENLHKYLAREEKYMPATVELLKNHKTVAEATQFFIYASGISDGGNNGFITLELDCKTNMTIITKLVGKNWKILFMYFGGIEQINMENPLIDKIYQDMMLSRYRDAEADLAKVESIFFMSPNVYFVRGVYHSNKQDYDIALNSFAKTAELYPPFPDLYYNFALVYHRKNELKKAKVNYLKYLDMTKNTKEPDLNMEFALFNLSCLYGQLNDLENAKLYAKKCLTINPNHEGAKQIVETIE